MRFDPCPRCGCPDKVYKITVKGWIDYFCKDCRVMLGAISTKQWFSQKVFR